MLPRKFIAAVPRKTVAEVEKRIAQKIPVKIRVAVYRPPETHNVAFGEIDAVLEVQRITLVRHRAAPVAVVPFVTVVPVPVIAVRIPIPRIIDFERALAEIAQPPPDGLSESHSVFGAQIESGGAFQSVFAFVEPAGDVIDVFRQQICAPPAGVARHHPPAVFGIHWIEPVRHPYDGDSVEIRPHVPEHHVLVLLTAALADDFPVQTRIVVGAGRDHGIPRHRH